MGFVRRVISGALDLANLKRHNDNFADIETDLIDHNARIGTAQVDITTHKASATAHAAETITYSGAVAGVDNLKEAVDTVKEQLNGAIIGGDSGPEAAAARASVSGTVYDTLGDRLNAEYEGVTTQLADISLNVKNFGAIGDGESHPLSDFFPNLETAQMKYPHATALTDEVDWAAIQGALNALKSSGGEVFVPKGTFLTNYPLKLYGATSYEDETHILRGTGNESAIHKTNNSTINGIDCIVYLENSQDETYDIYNLEINKIQFGSPTAFCEHGVYIAPGISYFRMNGLTVNQVNNAVHFVGNAWVCSMRNSFLSPFVNGLHLNGGTSFSIDNSFVRPAIGKGSNTGTGTAWRLKANYSFANSIACDNWNGTCYDVDYGDWEISGMGCESNNAAVAVKVQNQATLILTTFRFWSHMSKSAAIMFDIYGSSIIDINGANIGDDLTLPTSPATFMRLRDKAYASIQNVKVYGTFARNFVNDDHCKINVRSGNSSGFSISKYGMPYLGLHKGEASELDATLFAGVNRSSAAIFTSAVDNPTYMAGYVPVGDSSPVFPGDVFIINNPKTQAAMGYICISNTGATKLSECVFAKIPILSGGNTANRPSAPSLATYHYDTDLGKPVFWDGLAWNEKMSRFVSVPTSMTAGGKPGDWSADTNYLYICFALNTWRRIAASTW